MRTRNPCVVTAQATAATAAHAHLDRPREAHEQAAVDAQRCVGHTRVSGAAHTARPRAMERACAAARALRCAWMRASGHVARDVLRRLLGVGHALRAAARERRPARGTATGFAPGRAARSAALRCRTHRDHKAPVGHRPPEVHLRGMRASGGAARRHETSLHARARISPHRRAMCAARTRCARRTVRGPVGESMKARTREPSAPGARAAILLHLAARAGGQRGAAAAGAAGAAAAEERGDVADCCSGLRRPVVAAPPSCPASSRCSNAPRCIAGQVWPAIAIRRGSLHHSWSGGLGRLDAVCRLTWRRTNAASPTELSYRAGAGPVRRAAFHRVAPASSLRRAGRARVPWPPRAPG